MSMTKLKDFTDDFLDLLRSSNSASISELEKAFADAKEKYAKEIETKLYEEKLRKEKEAKINDYKLRIYNDYCKYLSVMYPDFVPDEKTKRRIFAELSFLDYAVGANKKLNEKVNYDDLDNFVNSMLKGFI